MKYTIFFPFAAFFLTTASAQYKGGGGQGTNGITTAALSLAAANTSYSGGSNDGQATLLGSALSLGTASQYSGGSNDGNHALLVSGLLLTASSPYSGGADDGTGSVIAVSLPLSATGNYTGGSNDGVSGVSAAALPMSSTGNYSGGTDDGSGGIAASALNLAAAGMYSGGINDGSGTITGTTLTMTPVTGMFFGGGNDGAGSVFAPSLSVVLPITWEAFNVRVVGADALLQWQVGNERNDAGFEVERSYDGNGFVKIGFVAASGGPGSINEYRYIDPRPADFCPAKACNEVFYRLRQIAIDGSFSFSPVKRLSLSPSALVASVYPNPASARLIINVNSSTGNDGYSLALYNGLGITVCSRNGIARGVCELDVRVFPSGIYFLKLAIDGRNYPYQITIQH